MFPSVTTVLAPWVDFSRVRPDVLAAAADRGRIVHRSCAAIVTGLWCPPVPEDCGGYVGSFMGWYAHAVAEVALVEPEFLHPLHGYCGHPDMLVRIKGDKGLTLIDLKTPLAFSKTWRPQLAAYKELADANNYPVDRVLSVRLRKTGAAPVVGDHTGTLAGDLSVFLCCLTAWKYFKGDRHA